METHNTKFYKGIEIEIKHDNDAENPFEAWDGCIPLINQYGKRPTDYSKGQIIDYLRNYLSYSQVKRHQVKLLNLMGENVETFKNDYPLNEYDRTEMIKDDFLYDWLNDGLENMEKFCIEFDIKHCKTSSRGYSQGDYSELFMCWTPEFEEVTGRSYESIEESDFKSAKELFSAWAWGDVYYFYIEETGDSCGGFYGDDFEKSGLIEVAKEHIDSHLEHKRKTKQSKLKTLIKNHVPLNSRVQILQAI